MQKQFSFRYIRIFFLFSVAPLLYFFWEWGGAENLLESVKAPAAVEAIRVGNPAPDFFVPAEKIWAKKDFHLHSVKGYPVVLHFWATWCGPCLQELPELLSLAEKLRPEGYTFIAVAVDDSWATLEKFFLQYPHLAKLKQQMVLVLDPDAQVAKTFSSSRFPETFLINDQMVVDNKFIGAQPWNDRGMKPYLETLRTQRTP